MPRPKKIKSPEDFGKEFEKLKKPMKQRKPLIHGGFGVPMKEVIEKFAESHEPKELTPLEELQDLEKKLRACTDETPRDIRYATFSGEEFDLHIEYNNITIIASMKDECSKFFAGRKCFNIECKKPYLATAHKMHEVLKEWRGK